MNLLDETKRRALHGLLLDLAAQNDPDCCPLEGEIGVEHVDSNASQLRH
jgi:hypothetical protein